MSLGSTFHNFHIACILVCSIQFIYACFLYCHVLFICSDIFPISRRVDCRRGTAKEGRRESGARDGRKEGGNTPVS